MAFPHTVYRLGTDPNFINIITNLELVSKSTGYNNNNKRNTIRRVTLNSNKKPKFMKNNPNKMCLRHLATILQTFLANSLGLY